VIDYLLKPVNKDKLIELLRKISDNLHESKSLSVKQMLEYINNNFMRDISLDDVARTAKLHPNYASSLFNKEMGIHFVQYLNSYRVMKAKAFLIKNPDMSLHNISKMSGFQSLEHFYKVFKKNSGVTPGDYRLSYLS
jgi:YesN/AraC family two-component response regulator